MKIAITLAASFVLMAHVEPAGADWLRRPSADAGQFEVGQLRVMRLDGADFDSAHQPFGGTGGTVGLMRLDGWRIGSEVAYYGDAIKNGAAGGGPADTQGRLSAMTIMGNLFYEIDTLSLVRPYFGGGVGLLRARRHDLIVRGMTVPDDTSTEIAFQVGTGIAIGIAGDVDLTLDYRFLIADHPDFDRLDAEFSEHSGTLGMRWRF